MSEDANPLKKSACKKKYESIEWIKVWGVFFGHLNSAAVLDNNLAEPFQVLCLGNSLSPLLFFFSFLCSLPCISHWLRSFAHYCFICIHLLKDLFFKKKNPLKVGSEEITMFANSAHPLPLRSQCHAVEAVFKVFRGGGETLRSKFPSLIC